MKNSNNGSKTIGYIRTCCGTEGQDVQKKQIIDYASAHHLEIDQFITVGPVSGIASYSERKIDTLLSILNNGDVLISTNTSRLSRNASDALAIFTQLKTKGVRVLFTNFDVEAADNSKVTLVNLHKDMSL